MSPSPKLTPSEFAAKWKGSSRTERAAAQEHFIDLCHMLGQPTPNEADAHGDWYAFEKGAEKTQGGDGFADVWKRAHFAWEYKGKKKDLKGAYDQLLQYREALENPPFLVVCDLDRFQVHTNFTGTKKTIYPFTLDDLRDAPAEPLRILRSVMSDPTALRPDQTAEQVTQEAASRFAELAGRLQSRGHQPLVVAHFLNRLLFCLFAEDIGLLPRGVLTRIIEGTRREPQQFTAMLKELFGKMAKDGGFFGAERIEWFNGGLFEDDAVLPLETEDLTALGEAATLDWSSVEPSILGTLFERGLDPAKRGQLGAHYTDRESILRVILPVVMRPLRREFEAMKPKVIGILAQAPTPTPRKAHQTAHRVFMQFLDRLRTVKVLDPACGSGNFLYLALKLLKDLEKEAILWGAETLGTTQETPGVGPQVVHGIEINPYAAELARVTIWIGQIQWMVGNGFSYRTNPILDRLESIEQRDAVLDRHDPEHPIKAVWPEAEFIVGNPPFIGGKKLRESLGDEYVDALFKAWDGEVPREADFVCYWHERARQAIEGKRCMRAGLLATQNIRSGANQRVLRRIGESGCIFEAWRDEPWVIDGADVRISIVCQDDGSEAARHLDGQQVEAIFADLAGGTHQVVDLTTARQLPENKAVAFMGDTKGGPFDVTGQLAREMLRAGPNPNGKPNSTVVVPWVNALDVARRPRDMFIVDFGVEMSEQDAAFYETPFEHVLRNARPQRPSGGGMNVHGQRCGAPSPGCSVSSPRRASRNIVCSSGHANQPCRTAGSLLLPQRMTTSLASCIPPLTRLGRFERALATVSAMIPSTRRVSRLTPTPSRGPSTRRATR
jgi:type II restriction/modification system DNA methylase subunit YeeA